MLFFALLQAQFDSMTDIEASIQQQQQQQQQLQNAQRVHHENCLQELQQQLSVQFGTGRFGATLRQQHQQQQQQQQHLQDVTGVPSNLVPFLPFLRPPPVPNAAQQLAHMVPGGHVAHQPLYSHNHNHSHAHTHAHAHAHAHKMAMQPMWPTAAVAAAHIQAALAAAAVAATTTTNSKNNSNKNNNNSNNNSNNSNNNINNNKNTLSPSPANATEAIDGSIETLEIRTASDIEERSSRPDSPAILTYSHNTPPDSPQGRNHSTEDSTISINFPSSPTDPNKSQVPGSEMDAPQNLSKPKGSRGSSPISSCLRDRERDQRDRLAPIVPSPPLNWQQMAQTASVTVPVPVPNTTLQHQSSPLFTDVETSFLQSRVSRTNNLHFAKTSTLYCLFMSIYCYFEHVFSK